MIFPFAGIWRKKKIGNWSNSKKPELTDWHCFLAVSKARNTFYAIVLKCFSWEHNHTTSYCKCYSSVKGRYELYLLVPSTTLSIHLEKMASKVSVTWAFCFRNKSDIFMINQLDSSNLKSWTEANDMLHRRKCDDIAMFWYWMWKGGDILGWEKKNWASLLFHLPQFAHV